MVAQRFSSSSFSVLSLSLSLTHIIICELYREYFVSYALVYLIIFVYCWVHASQCHYKTAPDITQTLEIIRSPLFIYLFFVFLHHFDIIMITMTMRVRVCSLVIYSGPFHTVNLMARMFRTDECATATNTNQVAEHSPFVINQTPVIVICHLFFSRENNIQSNLFSDVQTEKKILSIADKGIHRTFVSAE